MGLCYPRVRQKLLQRHNVALCCHLYLCVYVCAAQALAYWVPEAAMRSDAELSRHVPKDTQLQKADAWHTHTNTHWHTNMTIILHTRHLPTGDD
jgi:hypothetical protein